MVRNIGVDLGHASVTVSEVGKQIRREPSVILIDKATRRILSVGSAAERGDGRMPGTDCALVRPFKNGMLYSSDFTAGYINALIEDFKPAEAINCVVGTPSDFLPKQENELLSMFQDAGCTGCFVVNRALAALVGAGYSPTMSVISVNIGASATEIAILHKGKIIITSKEPVGSEDFDKAIQTHIQERGGLNISLQIAVKIKEGIGAVWPGRENESIDIDGELALTGTKVRMTLTTEDLVDVFAEPLRALIGAVANTVKGIPSIDVNDIFENGIILTGGGAELFGLDKMLERVLEIKVTRPEHAADAVAIGLSRIHKLIPTKRKLLGKNLTNQLAKLYEKA